MWKTAEAQASPTEEKQKILLDDLAQRDERVKAVLQALEAGEAIPGSEPEESVEQIAEEEFGELPEEMEFEGSAMAPDRLAQVTNHFHSLIGQGVPPTLAYMQVGIDHELSIIECDTLWELLKSQAEAMNDSFVNVDASQMFKNMKNTDVESVKKVVAQILEAGISASRKIVNIKAAQKKAVLAKKVRAARAIFPTEEIKKIAHEAAKHLSLGDIVPWADLSEAVEKIERKDDSIRHFASRMYDCNINPVQADHEPLYQGVRDSVIFVLQCILEKAGYEWDPKKSAWKKW